MSVNLPEQALQLHDIQLPAAASWWPPAPGWWVLTVLLLLIIVWLTRKFWRWQQTHRWRRHLQQQFNQQLPDPLSASDVDFANCLSTQLKRLVLTLYIEEQPAALYGQAWIDFLQQHGKLDCAKELVQLTESHYHSNPTKLTTSERQRLLTCCQRWAKQAISISDPREAA